MSGNPIRYLEKAVLNNTLKQLLIGVLEYTFLKGLSFSPTIYRKVAPKYYRWRSSDDVNNYARPPDVFKIEYVNPNIINRHSGRDKKHRNRRTMYGSVLDGNWDIGGERFSNTIRYESAKDHFCHGIPWEDTKLYEELVGGPDNRIVSHIFTDRKKEVRMELEEFDNLYHQIREEGYISQQELNKHKRSDGGLYLDTLDEITVDVGRDGELLFVDGRHRLTIAKLLDLDQIPVVFLVRHKEWMEYRDQVAEQDVIPDHPDLRDLK